MDTNYDMSLSGWCAIFGVVNNVGHPRYSHDLLNPPPLYYFNQMSFHKPIPKESSMESPAIHYFYYVITNTLQARGEFARLNEEDMMTLAHAMIPASNMSPNLGAMLLLHLCRQAHQTRGSITWGGVITVKANELGINLGNLHPLDGSRRVSILVLWSAGMI